MAEKAPIIVVKKKKGGHAGAHGGAWKVAYADFVTAMMCFFLVMWLMGADEETINAIESYFNNPATPFRPELSNKKNIPLGQKTGAGESILNGAEGQVPEDMIEAPVKADRQTLEDGDDGRAATAKELLENKFPALQLNVEYVRFSLPEDVLFEPGTDRLSPRGERYLEDVARMVKRYRGGMTIQGASQPAPVMADPYGDPYEFSLSRTVAVMQYFTKNRYFDEGRVATSVSDLKRNPASDDGYRFQKTRRIIFVLDR